MTSSVAVPASVPDSAASSFLTPRHILLETLCNTGIFAVLVALAVSVDLVVRWIEDTGTNPHVCTVLEGVALLLLAVDVFVFTCFLLAAALRAAQFLRRTYRELFGS